ncbi:MAG: SPOR domain-containing protein [Spirochaetaceae bacterium]|jgi:DedD protein|nr:SPOR domain-containing protein [Spirochaetaceae bacterium]
MEKKKLLLIAVSVGLFLVIVIGASILAFSPKNRSTPDIVRSAEERRSPPIAPGAAGIPGEGASLSGGIELVPPPPVPAMLENVIYINGENAEDAVKVERLNDGNTRTYITIPNSTPPAQPDVRFEPPKQAAPVEIVRETPPPPRQAAPATPKAKPPAAKPAAPPRAAPPPAKPSRADYWVQTGSFRKRSGADNAKTSLAEKGIGSLIFDSTVNGNIVYRVRVGPYASQSEANYWLALVQKIDGMQDSLVWKSMAH